MPGRDQIGVNNHLPVLIERAGLFQFISHRLVARGVSPLQKAGADQDLRPVTDRGNRFVAGKKAPGDLKRLRLFSHNHRRCAPGQNQNSIVVRVDLVKILVHGHFVAVLALDGPVTQGSHCHFDARLLQPVVGDQQLRVLEIVRTDDQGFHIFLRKGTQLLVLELMRTFEEIVECTLYPDQNSSMGTIVVVCRSFSTNALYHLG